MSANQTSPPAEPMRRGRPRLPNALTAAQRAKRYRDKKRARDAATQAAGTAPRTAAELLAENNRLLHALGAARIRISDLTGALEFFVEARSKNRKISAEQMKGLHALLALGDPLAEAFSSDKKQK